MLLAEVPPAVVAPEGHVSLDAALVALDHGILFELGGLPHFKTLLNAKTIKKGLSDCTIYSSDDLLLAREEFLFKLRVEGKRDVGCRDADRWGF